MTGGNGGYHPITNSGTLNGMALHRGHRICLQINGQQLEVTVERTAWVGAQDNRRMIVTVRMELLKALPKPQRLEYGLTPGVMAKFVEKTYA